MSKTTSKEFIEVLEKEIKALSSDINEKEERLQRLQVMVDELKKYGSYEELYDQYTTLSEKYEKEKERLVKLHYLFKKKESEYNELNSKVDEWLATFDEQSDMLKKMFSTTPAPIQKSKPDKRKKTETKQTATKSKKKLCYRKKSATSAQS